MRNFHINHDEPKTWLKAAMLDADFMHALDQELDEFSHIAGLLTDTPVAFIALFSDHAADQHHWLTNSIPWDTSKSTSVVSICQQVAVDKFFVEGEFHLQSRVSKHQPDKVAGSVTGFYAACKLTFQDGDLLGWLCVVDTKARQLTVTQRESFTSLARKISRTLHRILHVRTLEQVNRRLSEKASFYDTLLQSAEDAIISTRPDGIITSFSMGAEAMLGYRAEELVDLKTPALLHDAQEMLDRAAELSKTYGRSIKAGFDVFVCSAREGLPETRLWTYLHKDGRRIPVSLTVTAMYDEAAELIGFLGIARDISESEQAKESLATLADLLQRTGEMANVGGWDLDIQSNELQWTRQVFAIHEVEPPLMPELNQALMFYPAESRPQIQAAVAAGIAHGTPWDLELPFITAKGRHRWVRAQGIAIMHQGKPTRLVGAFQDVTERISGELERQASATKLAENARFIKTITDAMPALVAYWDKNLLCRFANQPYLHWFGKDPERIIGHSMKDLLGEYLFAINQKYIEGALAGRSQQFERVLTKQDGSCAHTWANYIPDIDADSVVKGFFVLVTDVTPIKSAEYDLRLAASVFQNTIEGIMVTDADGAILSVNPAFSKITGYAADEAIGCNPRLFKSFRHEASFYSDMWSCLTSTGLWRGEVWNKRKSGEVHPDLMTITAVKDGSGKLSNYVAIFTDNTEYQEQERLRIAEELLQRDTLVREVHHRIKNNLQSVANLLGNFSAQYPELSGPILSAITQVKSIALVHGLKGGVVNSEVRLAELIKAIAENNQVLWSKTIAVSFSSAWSSMLIAEKEAVPIALVLNELILNAVKHGDKANDVSVNVSFDPELDQVSIVISNIGAVKLYGSPPAPQFGVGLQLVSTLLPKRSASLFWEQLGDRVLTKMVLSKPIVKREHSIHNE